METQEDRRVDYKKIEEDFKKFCDYMNTYDCMDRKYVFKKICELFDAYKYNGTIFENGNLLLEGDIYYIYIKDDKLIFKIEYYQKEDEPICGFCKIDHRTLNYCPREKASRMMGGMDDIREEFIQFIKNRDG